GEEPRLAVAGPGGAAAGGRLGGALGRSPGPGGNLRRSREVRGVELPGRELGDDRALLGKRLEDPEGRLRPSARSRLAGDPEGRAQAAEADAAAWLKIVDAVGRLAAERDREWMRRRRILDTLPVILFMFRPVPSRGEKGYETVLAELREQCRKLGI
ncbi:MAG: hypothetical protein OXC26_25950, partial [Albidovulum sp.]|nr:hypothetical protein [Albidovulum sp.]